MSQVFFLVYSSTWRDPQIPIVIAISGCVKQQEQHSNATHSCTDGKWSCWQAADTLWARQVHTVGRCFKNIDLNFAFYKVCIYWHGTNCCHVYLVIFCESCCFSYWVDGLGLGVDFSPNNEMTNLTLEMLPFTIKESNLPNKCKYELIICGLLWFF